MYPEREPSFIKLISESESSFGIGPSARVEIHIHHGTNKDGLYIQFKHFMQAMGYHIDNSVEVGEIDEEDNEKYAEEMNKLHDKIDELENKIMELEQVPTIELGDTDVSDS